MTRTRVPKTLSICIIGYRGLVLAMPIEYVLIARKVKIFPALCEARTIRSMHLPLGLVWVITLVIWVIIIIIVIFGQRAANNVATIISEAIGSTADALTITATVITNAGSRTRLAFAFAATIITNTPSCTTLTGAVHSAFFTNTTCCTVRATEIFPHTTL
jgi:hypothetical protein